MHPRIFVLAIVVSASGCNLFGLGGTQEAKPPYKESATLQPCPGEKVDAKCQPYVDCAPTRCDSAYKQCLGDDYKNGNFGGPCKAFMECGKACSDVCASDCNCKPDMACSDCLTDPLATCVVGQCIEELYACAGLPPPSQGGACTQLTACCSTLEPTKKADCEKSATTARAGGDSTCQTLLSTYQSSGKCKFLDGPKPTTCSMSGGAATTINFKNNSSDKTYVTYWIDYTCEEKQYATIAPGGTSSQGTYVGHPWRIRDSSGKFVKDVPGNTGTAAITVDIP